MKVSNTFQLFLIVLLNVNGAWLQRNAQNITIDFSHNIYMSNRKSNLIPTDNGKESQNCFST